MTTGRPPTALDVMIMDLVGPTETRREGLVAVAEHLGINTGLLETREGRVAVAEHLGIDAGVLEPEAVLLAMITQVRPWCRLCGCTDDFACEEGCTWVEGDLCSSHQGDPLARARGELLDAVKASPAGMWDDAVVDAVHALEALVRTEHKATGERLENALARALVEAHVAVTRAYRLLSHVRRDLPSEMATAVAAAVLVLAEAGLYGDSEDLEALLSQPAGGAS